MTKKKRSTTAMRPFALVSVAHTTGSKYLTAVILSVISLTVLQYREIPFNHLSRLGYEAKQSGQFDRARQLRLMALTYAIVFFPDRNSVGDSAFNLACVCREQGDFKAAKYFCGLALKSEVGLAHHLETTQLLGEIFDLQGREDESELFFEEIARHGSAVNQQCGRSFTADLNNLAGVYIRHKKYDKARQTLLSLIDVDLKRTDNVSLNLHRDLIRLAYVERKQGARASTAVFLRSVVYNKLLFSKSNLEIVESFVSADQIMSANNGKGKISEAYQPVWDLLDSRAELSWSAHDLVRLHAFVLLSEGRYEEAEHVLRKQYKLLMARSVVNYGATADSLSRLAHCLQAQGRLTESVPIEAQAEIDYKKATSEHYYGR